MNFVINLVYPIVIQRNIVVNTDFPAPSVYTELPYRPALAMEEQVPR
jgi:hypothetical protein